MEALVTVDALRQYVLEIVLLVAALVIIVRPVTVTVSMFGTRLGGRGRALIASVDPRGIVAASTAAAFTGSPAAAGHRHRGWDIFVVDGDDPNARLLVVSDGGSAWSTSDAQSRTSTPEIGLAKRLPTTPAGLPPMRRRGHPRSGRPGWH